MNSIRNKIHKRISKQLKRIYRNGSNQWLILQFVNIFFLYGGPFENEMAMEMY